jgi:hypothetical protein
MKILFVIYNHAYDKHGRRVGEHLPDYYLWYEPLVHLAGSRGHTVEPFWLDDLIEAYGREGMRQKYYELLTKGGYDVVLYFPPAWDIGNKVLAKVQRDSEATTVLICGDDSWAFNPYYKPFVPYFTWAATSFTPAIAWYRAIGCRNIVHFQTGVSLAGFRPVPGPKAIDVSFVGRRSLGRQKIIDALKQAGIEVLVRGMDWPEGGVPQEEMLAIISHSKISLNLNPVEFHLGLHSLARLFFRWPYFGEGCGLKWDGWNFMDNLKSLLASKLGMSASKGSFPPVTIALFLGSSGIFVFG